MLINGLGIGVPYKTFRGAGETLNQSSLYLPLKSTIVPSKGTSTPTFTRATTAWSFDNEGKLNQNIPSGCVRFKGGRLVRNLILGPSNDITSFTKTNTTTPSANVLQASTGDAPHYAVRNTSVLSAVGQVYTIYCRLQKESHSFAQLTFNSGAFGTSIYLNINLDTGVYNLYGASQAQVTPVSTGVWDVQFYAEVTTASITPGFVVALVTALNSSRLETLNAVGTESIGVLQFAYYNVSGESTYLDQLYVSVGVLSSPYHGAGTVSGADGCKWFPTNKDGSAISTSTLEGYFAEPQRTNNCLYSRDLSKGSASSATWWLNNHSATEILNAPFTSDVEGFAATSGATVSWSAGRLSVTRVSTNTERGYKAFTTEIGKTYQVSVACVAGAAVQCSLWIGASSTTSELGSKTQPTAGAAETISLQFTALNTTTYVSLGMLGNTTRLFDNVLITEAAVQVTTTTGLDNIANSATRLTATANDATILQLLTAATGTRTLSAYIKRVSGSGTISLTRDGGTGWTDITSSLVTDSWVLVQMTSDVGANPTVGIKMGTSGDVIDVDCVQDENGAWATSPILTTTAAVTRNADVLSYASAFDVTQGSALCTLQSNVPLGVGMYALGSETGGRLLYWTTATARNRGSSYDAVTVATSNIADDVNMGLVKRGNRWGSDQRCYALGGVGTSVAFDGSMGTSGTLFVGSNEAGSAQISGPIREVHIWPTPLTDAQMKQVTS